MYILERLKKSNTHNGKDAHTEKEVDYLAKRIKVEKEPSRCIYLMEWLQMVTNCFISNGNGRSGNIHNRNLKKSSG